MSQAATPKAESRPAGLMSFPGSFESIVNTLDALDGLTPPPRTGLAGAMHERGQADAHAIAIRKVIDKTRASWPAIDAHHRQERLAGLDSSPKGRP